MSVDQLHKTQVSILHSLRYNQSERFNTLMRHTGHTSDTFKFHLQKLVKLGYLIKLSSGAYQLTTLGKEFANSLDEPKRIIKKQPIVSVLAVVHKKNSDGTTVYLVQKRARNPFYGYWGEIHGRSVWGESFEATASHQLKRQAGLEATFTVRAFRRVRDYTADDKTLLEDKLFVIVEATHVSGELNNSYSGGTNAWLTLPELRDQEKVFASTLAIIEELDGNTFYRAHDIVYDQEDY